MPDYTYAPAPVLVEATGEFAIGATGVLRTSSGEVVQVYDLNSSPLSNVVVGPKGAHQAFLADIPDGVLDFGSVLLPAISAESTSAALTAIGIANDALNAALTSVSRFVFAGDDGNFPRPNIAGPLLWLCSVEPVNADENVDVWFPLGTVAPGGGGGDGNSGVMVPSPSDPDLYTYSGIASPSAADPDLYHVF